MATTTSKLAGNTVKKQTMGVQPAKTTPTSTMQGGTIPLPEKATAVDQKAQAKFLDSVCTEDVEDIVLAIITAGEFDTLSDEALDQAMQNVKSALEVKQQNHFNEVDLVKKELDYALKRVASANESLKKSNDRVKLLCGIIAEM